MGYQAFADGPARAFIIAAQSLKIRGIPFQIAERHPLADPIHQHRRFVVNDCG
ncbi:hypothetical protein D3C75_1320150 [compost metagenome]